MAYSLTSAANLDALLSEVLTFATAQGWTVSYNDIAGAGGFGAQVGLHSGNCHVAIGEQTATINPVAVAGLAGAFSDTRAFMALGSSINPANPQYWGHPGSIVATATDADRVFINDLHGPFSEVHLFGSVDYVHVHARSDAGRWTTFGFGNVDTLGMGIDACGYAFGMYHEFWRDEPYFSTTRENVNLGRYSALPFNASYNQNAVQLFLPAGVLDASLGFSASAQVVSSYSPNIVMPLYYAEGYFGSDKETAGQASRMLDHVAQVATVATTGGVPLWSVPAFFYEKTLGLSVFLGQLPGIRFANIALVSPGSVFSYGPDEWLAVPAKMKGTEEDALSTAVYAPNSGFFGYASLK